ncbi:MAG: TrkA family potassium uptake protein [Spirochaetes bacterium]|nr:TrkA family potassium uptake protein [Spirochaetota bacterium]
MKKYVVIGLGNFGFTLAKSLVESGCEVLGIDISRDAINEAKEFLTHVIIGDASKREVLEALSLKDFDGAVVSIGQKMEPSILISLYLKEIGINRIIVRAITEDHGKILSHIGVSDVIFPERDMALRIAKTLAMKNVIDFLPLGEDYGIIEIFPPKKFLGKSLRELRIPNTYNCQVIGLKYFPKDSHNFIDEKMLSVKMAPSADDVIQENMMMIIIGKYEDLSKLQSI